MRRNSWLFLVVVVLLLAPVAMAQSTPQSKTFNVGPGGSLVAVVVGDVAMRTSPSAQVTVQVYGIENEDLQDLSMEQTGNTVRIQYRPQGGQSDVRFEIGLPAQFDIDVKTAGGDVSVDGALTGRLTARTAGGDVRVGDVDGMINLSTAGGDVIAGKVGGDATLKTSGGDIRLDYAEGQVVVHTSGGDIVVGDVRKSLDAKTSGGDIRLSNVNGDATASTAGGDVRVGKVAGSARLSTAGGDVECLGATGRVQASTAGGDIKMSDISGSLTASTAGGDIIADLTPDGSAESSLKTAGGDLLISLPAGASARVEAIIHIQGRWNRAMNEYQIRSDFKAVAQEADDAARELRATYQIGGGGSLIRLETTNGNITVRKSAK